MKVFELSYLFQLCVFVTCICLNYVCVIDLFLRGVVVERRTPNREVLGSIPTGVIELCPSARHINSLQYSG